ncbi:MAG: polysaccharide biosynthesis protein [Planctomycetota bacterium]
MDSPPTDLPEGVTLFRSLDEALDSRDTARFREVLISLPESHEQAARDLSSRCDQLGIPSRHCLTPEQMLDGRPQQNTQLDNRQLSELIGRTPRVPDARRLDGVLKGKRVLITGAGGSIGSELARIAHEHNPESLILMDRSENALFELDRQLGASGTTSTHRVHLQDVVDEAGTLRAMLRHKPDVVFHAAAHKHVPMMEDHPGQAITNNLFGTRSVLEASIEAGVSRFVLISTDKAVEPSSVMGASKRLAELYVMARHRTSEMSCSIVRFGNVLASACSVIPIWRDQIRRGRPITLTDPAMTRYFMTIPEAASLVIQSASLNGSHADVFVLDMGEPVRILDLAERFIRSCGGTPRRIEGPESVVPPGEIPLVVTGIRPGEKLHEELSYSAEALQPTPIEGINSWRAPLDDTFDAEAMITQMDQARREESDRRVHDALERWVDGYRAKTVISVSDRVLSRAG